MDPTTVKEPPFDEELIRQFLEYPEGYGLDFKRVSGKMVHKALETVTAFSNTEGGILVLGLDDPEKAEAAKRIYGLQENPSAVDEFRRKVRSHITPEISGISFIEIGCTLNTGAKGSILFVKIPKSGQMHSILEGGTFVRMQKSDRQLTAAEITALSFAKGVVTAESEWAEVDFELLDTPLWKEYFRHRRLSGSINDALLRIGLAKKRDGKIVPLKAAVLLFADDPSGLIGGKCAIRIFRYSGMGISHEATPNLMKKPKTIGGPLIRQIEDAMEYIKSEIASGVMMSKSGFKTIHKYPERVIKEAITNAVIHRDYHIQRDIHVRIFDDRIEIESPGLFPGTITPGNIRNEGSVNRNSLLVSHLREFPDPPNLDAGEGVRMMFNVMHQIGLYDPIYLTKPPLSQEAVIVCLFNEERPSLWDQVSVFIDKHGRIANRDLCQLGEIDTLRASKFLRQWVKKGLLIIENPEASKKSTAYTKPGVEKELPLLSFQKDNKE